MDRFIHTLYFVVSRITNELVGNRTVDKLIHTLYFVHNRIASELMQTERWINLFIPCTLFSVELLTN